MSKQKLFYVLILSLLLISTEVFGLDMSVADSLLSHNNIDYVRAGQAAFREGDYEEAIEQFFNYWQTQRDDYNALLQIAIAYSQLNNPELAGRFLQEAQKRTIIQFSREITERHFETVYENEIFQNYLHEVYETIDEQEKQRGFISYIETPTKMRYRTILPENFDPEKEYPVMIYMHGYGGNPHNIFYVSDLLIENDFIFVLPYAPYPFEISSREFTSLSWGIFDYDEGEFNDSHSGMLTRNYILKLNYELRQNYNVKSLFLSGFSQGGFNTLGIGLTNQEMFEGLICFGGALFLDDEDFIDNGNIPVLIVHGESDMAVRYESGVEAFERLKNRGYDVELYSFDGAHVMNHEIVTKAIEWMKSR
ncbi:MAG: dienelactone hydrolase family protein [Candidatus Cloacimonetes bacterium]|nr:dienelactone hydrolase family protein [Candidatus Cloacimonadota bacterium]